MLLLSSKLISKAGSINHCLLGLLFRVLGLVEHVINFSMHGMDGRFKTPLVRASLRVDGSHVIDGTSCFSQFHISLLLATISRIKKSTSFLKLSLKSISTAISQTSLLSNLTKLSLVPLDGFVSLSIGLIGMVKSNFELIDVRLKLLLDTKSLSLCSRFSLQRSLQGIHQEV